MSKKHNYSKEQIKQMRDWIADCSWAEEPFFDVNELSDEEVIAGIRWHYDGGLKQFFLDIEPVTIKKKA